MRVAVVTTSYPTEAGDAAGHFVASEARHWAEAGHEVTVCAPGNPALCATYDAIANIRTVRFDAGDLFAFPGALQRLRLRPLRILIAAKFIRRVRAWLDTHGPFDLIQAHWLLPCGWPIAIDRAAALEIVCHGSDIELFSRLPKPLRHQIAARLQRGDTRLRFVSNRQREELERIAPELCTRSVVKPCAIDTSMAPSRAEARLALGIPSDARTVLVIGRLIASKRIDLALEGLARIQNLTTLVIGDGPLRATLQMRFPGVRFLGQLSRPETLAWLAAADLLVSASIREGAPTVIREARQLQVPVVAQEVGDLRSWAKLDPGLQLFQKPSELVPALRRQLVVKTAPLTAKKNGSVVSFGPTGSRLK